MTDDPVIIEATFTDITPPKKPETVLEPKSYSIEELAQKVINEAMGPTVAFEDRVDAFKAVTTYHVGVAKLNGKKPPAGDDNVSTFADIKSRIQGA